MCDLFIRLLIEKYHTNMAHCTGQMWNYCLYTHLIIIETLILVILNELLVVSFQFINTSYFSKKTCLHIDIATSVRNTTKKEVVKRYIGK